MCSNEGTRWGSASSGETKPIIRVTGKPAANTLSCDAARVSTASAALVISNTPIRGSDNITARAHDHAAPLREHHPVSGERVVGGRRDAFKRWDQRRDQQQVPVARQEDERRGQSDELTDDGYLGAGLGVVKSRKAEPHLPQVLGRGARRNGGARSGWQLSLGNCAEPRRLGAAPGAVHSPGSK